jgi:hypothetical protein
VAKKTRRNQGKTEFVEQFLRENPQGNVTAVIEAWKASGKSGAISGTLINKTRSRLGLTGNLRGRPRKGAPKAAPVKRRGRRPKSVEAAPAPAPARLETRGRKSNRDKALLELEAEIDRLLFKTMEMGGMTEIEEGLRGARRLLYAAQSQ